MSKKGAKILISYPLYCNARYLLHCSDSTPRINADEVIHSYEMIFKKIFCLLIMCICYNGNVAWSNRHGATIFKQGPSIDSQKILQILVDPRILKMWKEETPPWSNGNIAKPGHEFTQLYSSCKARCTVRNSQMIYVCAKRDDNQIDRRELRHDKRPHSEKSKIKTT